MIKTMKKSRSYSMKKIEPKDFTYRISYEPTHEGTIEIYIPDENNTERKSTIN